MPKKTKDRWIDTGFHRNQGIYFGKLGILVRVCKARSDEQQMK